MSSDQLTKLATALGGLPILGTRPGGPAERVGIRYGDILLTVNGMPTPDWSSYLTARESRPNEMEVAIFRNGEELTFLLVLDKSERLDPVAVLNQMLAD